LELYHYIPTKFVNHIWHTGLLKLHTNSKTAKEHYHDCQVSLYLLQNFTPLSPPSLLFWFELFTLTYHCLHTAIQQHNIFKYSAEVFGY